MKDRELMQKVLDALNTFDKGNHGMRWQVPVIKALRAALAQPELVIQARKEGDLIVVDLPKVPTGGGGIYRDEQPENEFSHDWNAMSVMVEEQRRMAKRIEELELALAQPEPEPFEYWNAVEGWVKIDEVRQHFDTAGCGTIYKTAGEDRVPLYTAPPQRESVYCGCGDEIVSGDGARCGTCVAVKYREKGWVGLTDEEYEAMAEKCVTNCYFDTLKYARAIEARLRDKNS